MTIFRPFQKFTAQAKNLAALDYLYLQMNRNPYASKEMTPTVVFLAFTVESYINSIGSRKIDFWDEIERLPWKSKIKILHKSAMKEANWGIDPLQFATEIFTLRDKLAHGKPERIEGPNFETEEEAQTYLEKSAFEPIWYKELTIEWTDNAYSRFKVLMTYLGQIFDLHEFDYLTLAEGGIIRDDDSSA